MSYFVSKKVYQKKSPDEIFYRIEWDEQALVKDADNINNGRSPLPLFNVYCVTEKEGRLLLGTETMLAGALKIVKNHLGMKPSQSFWIQYCYTISKLGKAYIIYLTRDEPNGMYILSVSRDNGQHTHPYCAVSDSDISDALQTQGNDLKKAIMDIAENDIAAGIVDRYLDQHDFVLTEYIADATQDLFSSILQDKGAWKTSDPITSLCFNALKCPNGIETFPTYPITGEMSLLVRGHIASDNYEFTAKLRLQNGNWYFIKETIFQNDIFIYGRTFQRGGGYMCSSDNNNWRDDPTPLNCSQLIFHLPRPIVQWLKDVK